MAYTVVNFNTKKALKAAVSRYNNENHNVSKSGVRCYQPGLGPDLSNFTGKVCLEGPHYPKPHTWYAEAWLENGVVIKVK